MNKLSLVGMQLPDNKYKKNFDVSSEGPSLTPDEESLLETSKFSLCFQVFASLPTKACSISYHSYEEGACKWRFDCIVMFSN